VTYGDFIILLARQRSGTNPVRSILESHPDVFCFNEVFNFGDKGSDDPLLRDSNFFNFLETYARGDLNRITPDKHERVFLDFVEYLRCFSSKQYIVVDVKYNTTHFLTEQWARNMTRPYLLDLIVRHGLKVLNLTRKNYLRYVLSSEKAWHSGPYTVTTPNDGYTDHRRWLDLDFLFGELETCYDEDAVISKRFASYAEYRAFDYAELFTGEDEAIAPWFLAEIADWLDVSNTFDPVSEFRKQSYLTLPETIENFDDVAAALADSKFEYCLEDELLYRQGSTRTTAERRSL